MTTWSELDAEVASEVVARWRTDRRGPPLRSVPFAAAQDARCHDNAAAYAHVHGGDVTGGFLVEHPAEADWVYVRAHSVVRRDGALIDPTLSAEQLRTQAFFEYTGSPEAFQGNARRWAQILVKIAISDVGNMQRFRSD